mgnify:CR=1 FL=1
MKTYIGTKIIQAQPMTLGEYTQYRKWNAPHIKEINNPGYIIRYPNNYISWCPKEEFEKVYSSDTNHSFGDALALLKLGYKVKRTNWNANNMWLALQEGTVISATEARGGAAKHYANEILPLPTRDIKQIRLLPHIDMKNAQNQIVVGWQPSQADMLSNDWQIVL